MSFFRTLIIWILAFSLPVEAVVSVSMSQCKDMQMSMSGPLRPGANPMHHDMSAKDHAAMMGASVGADSNVSSLHKHHSMAKADGSSDIAKSLGCKCGCKCSGNCAVSCAAMLGTLAADRCSWLGLAAKPMRPIVLIHFDLHRPSRPDRHGPSNPFPACSRPSAVLIA